MPRTVHDSVVYNAGATVKKKFVIPVVTSDPGSPEDGWVWLNTVDHALRWREAGNTYTAGTSTLDTEGVRDAVADALQAGDNIDIVVDDTGDTFTISVSGLTSGDIADFLTDVRGAITVADTSTVDLTYTAGGLITAAVLDSPTLQGSDKAYYRNVDNHQDGTTNHVFTALDDTKLAGIEAEATKNAADSFLLNRANHSGDVPAANVSGLTSAVRSAISVTDSDTLDLTFTGGAISAEVLDSPTVDGNTAEELRDVDTHVSGTTNKVFTAVEKTKLAAVQAGATANDTNENLRDRSTHTGDQPASTISDFTSAGRALISATDSSTLDLTYTAATGVVTGAVLDSPTLEGSNKAYYRNVDNHQDGTTNHVFTAADDTKLTGIATGATANATNEQLRDRSTHTGDQPASTISDFAAAVAALSLDADTLDGKTLAQIQTLITSAIVNGAPAALDTLKELSDAIAGDANYATTLTNLVATRSRFFTAAVPATALDGGTGYADAVITHNLGTTSVVVQVWNVATGFQEDFGIGHTSGNTITIRAEGAAIPGSTYEVNIIAAA